MKKKIYKLFAVMLFFAVTLFLLSCPAFFSENRQHLLSGNFGPFKFVANPVAERSARSNIPFDTQELIGTMFDGDDHYEVTGYYDEKTGNFILTAISGGAIFTIEGILRHDNWEGTGNFIGEDSAGYTLEEWEITFDNTVDLHGNPISLDGPAFPELFWGTWDYSQGGLNAFKIGNWYTAHGEDGEFCMVISKYGIAMWNNIVLAANNHRLRSDPDIAPEDIELSVNYYIDQMRDMMTTYSILEIQERSDISPPGNYIYDVLVGVPIPKFCRTSDEPELVYRKIRFEYYIAEEVLTATLGNYNGFDAYDIETARLITEFRDDDAGINEGLDSKLIMRRVNQEPSGNGIINNKITTIFDRNSNLSLSCEIIPDSDTSYSWKQLKAEVIDTNDYGNDPSIVKTYTWIIDDKIVGNNKSIIYPSSYPYLLPGTYSGIVVVTIDTGVYSQPFIFEVE